MQMLDLLKEGVRVGEARLAAQLQTWQTLLTFVTSILTILTTLLIATIAATVFISADHNPVLSNTYVSHRSTCLSLLDIFLLVSIVFCAVGFWYAKPIQFSGSTPKFLFGELQLGPNRPSYSSSDLIDFYEKGLIQLTDQYNSAIEHNEKSLKHFSFLIHLILSIAILPIFFMLIYALLWNFNIVL